METILVEAQTLKKGWLLYMSPMVRNFFMIIFDKNVFNILKYISLKPTLRRNLQTVYLIAAETAPHIRDVESRHS